MEINIISLNGNYYGLPTSAVCEVLGPVPVTPLPFSPDYVAGLANIGGSVILQVDLSVRVEGAEKKLADSGQLIVVECSGERIALHADHALLMVSVADEDISQVDSGELKEGLNPKLFTGVFQWTDKTVLNLAVDQLGLEGLEAIESQAQGSGLVATEVSSDELGSSEKDVSSLVSYLVVESGGEHYAVAMERVRFVEDLKVLTTLPQTPPEVLGMTYSHNAPLLVLGLGLMMGQREGVKEKLVVVEHQDFRCALKVDCIHGIRRLSCRDNHEIMAKGGELEGYLLGEDQRLIGVLNFDVLFSDKRMESLRSFLVDDRRSLGRQEHVPTRRLLTFSVGRERCALPLSLVDRVVEYMKVEALPEGGEEHLHGAVQIYGDILPVIDLRLKMGVAAEITASTAYVVAGEENNRWAIVVDQLDRVVEIPETDLESVSSKESQNMEAIGRIDNGLLRVMSLSALTMATSVA